MAVTIQVHTRAGEGELLFPPLSHLEVVGNPKVVKFNDKPVVVVSVKVNVNQKALTIEDMLRQRQRSIRTVGENLAKEIVFDLQLVSDEPCDWYVRTLRDHMKEEVAEKDPTWFNTDSNLKAALDKVLALKQTIIREFVKDNLKDAPKEVRRPCPLSRTWGRPYCWRMDTSCSVQLNVGILLLRGQPLGAGVFVVVAWLTGHEMRRRIVTRNFSTPHIAAEQI